ncbi:MAG: HD domain-containing protein [Anaerolineae bacterium]
MFERNLTRKEFELIQQIETFVREKHRREAGHDYSHVLAITGYAIEITRAIPEEVDPFVLICGALFHDIGRVGTHTGIVHGLRGATIVREYLDAIGVSPDIRDKITRIVARHTPTTRQAPETIEEKIVYDADALDRLGFMGMLRGLMGKKGSTQDILEDRIQKRLGDYGKLHFEASRRIGEKLHEETLGVVQSFRVALEERNEEITNIDWPVRKGAAVEVPPPI